MDDSLLLQLFVGSEWRWGVMRSADALSHHPHGVWSQLLLLVGPIATTDPIARRVVTSSSASRASRFPSSARSTTMRTRRWSTSHTNLLPA